MLTEINQTADLEIHQCQIRNVKKIFSPRVNLSFVFQKVPGEYFTTPHWVWMCIMCWAAVKKSRACIYTVTSFFFLQPSGKHHCEYSSLKVSQRQRESLCVYAPVPPGRKHVVISTISISRTWSVCTGEVCRSDCNCAVFAELGWGISWAYISL